MIFSTEHNEVLWPSCLDARGFIVSLLSSNLLHAFTLTHNQTTWWDYQPHNQIKWLWADYHLDSFTVNQSTCTCEFVSVSCMYLVHNTIFILRVFVRGQRPVESLVGDQWFECECMCWRVLVLLHGLLHMRQKNRHKPCTPWVTAKGTGLYVYITVALGRGDVQSHPSH